MATVAVTGVGRQGSPSEGSVWRLRTLVALKVRFGSRCFGCGFRHKQAEQNPSLHFTKSKDPRGHARADGKHPARRVSEAPAALNAASVGPALSRLALDQTSVGRRSESVLPSDRPGWRLSGWVGG